MHEHDALASTAKLQRSRSKGGPTHAPFRETFGQSHMQAIFDRHTDADSRERIFSPACYGRFDGRASDEHGQILPKFCRPSER